MKKEKKKKGLYTGRKKIDQTRDTLKPSKRVGELMKVERNGNSLFNEKNKVTYSLTVLCIFL